MRKALYAFSDSPGCRSQTPEGSFGCVSLKIDMEAFSRPYLECPSGNSNLKQPSFWGRFGASLDRMVQSDLASTISKNSLSLRPTVLFIADRGHRPRLTGVNRWTKAGSLTARGCAPS